MLIAVLAAAAEARPVCGERDTIIANLSDKFDEQVIAMALTNRGGVIEVLTSPSGSWTFLVTEPNGRACLVASGEAWMDVEPERGETL